MKQITLWLLLLSLAGCGGDTPTTRLPPLTPPAVAARPTATPAATPAPPAATPAATPTATPAATPAPAPTSPPGVRLLADRDEAQPRAGFGPASPGLRWLVTNDAERFSLVALNSRLMTGGAASVITGTPLDWTADGSLLLFLDPGDPTSLLALEPTAGVTLTLLADREAPLTGAAWLTSVILYATDEADGAGLAIHAYRGSRGGGLLARLPDHRLLPGGMIGSPNRREAALLVSSTISPTTELYRLDEDGNLARIDSHAGAEPGASAVWAADGRLAYNLGGGMHVFDPLANSLQATGLEADPLSWQGDAILVRRREDGALLRWRLSGIQPFDTGSGPLVVDDAQLIGPSEAALLIGGQIWAVALP